MFNFDFKKLIVKYKPGTGLLLGLLVTAPVTGIMYLAFKLTGLPFAPFNIFDFITGILPGPVITFGIDTMIHSMFALGLNVAEAAKKAEHLASVIMFVSGGVIVGMLYSCFIKARGIKPGNVTGAAVGIVSGMPVIIISLVKSQSEVNPVLQVLWLCFLYLLWGLALNRASSFHGLYLNKRNNDHPDTNKAEVINRRQFLVRFGAASSVITVAGTGLGAVLSSELFGGIGESADISPVMNLLPNLNDRVKPAPGTRPEYTPLDKHYKVFIRSMPTYINGSGWKLPITGLVSNPVVLTLKDIKNNYKSYNVYATISCISNRLGGNLIGTTQWTGVRMQDVLRYVKPLPGARYVYIKSGDGFYETVDIELIMKEPRIMLCYSWDGKDLPADHGYPLRIWIPDLYGMKQPKWITEMNITDKYKKGYWVERDWDSTAQVKITSAIDTVAVKDAYNSGGKRLVPVGGIAYSGARGISKVEVRIDGGKWRKASLRSPLSDTTWVIWRYDWPFTEGKHLFEVRCTDKAGRIQAAGVQPSHPSGATGIHSYRTTAGKV